MGNSRIHRSKYTGASRHGGGPNAGVGNRDGKTQTPVPYGRYDRYPGGVVPQSTRTPEEQLAHLDTMGFIATKERAKLKLRIEKASAPNKPKKEKKHGKKKKRNPVV